MSHTMTIEQKKEFSRKRVAMELSPYEIEVVMELRKFNHGRFIIQMFDGIPVRYITEISKVFFEENNVSGIMDRLENKPSVV